MRRSASGACAIYFAERSSSTDGLPNPRTDPIAHLQLQQTLRELLDERRLEEIAEMAVRRKRVLGSLVSMTYDADLRISWRAVEFPPCPYREFTAERIG
jgi:hypothetical protein